MKKSIITITTLLTIALLTASAYAWGPGRGMGFGPNGDCPRYSGQKGYTASNLSQEQKDEFKALRQRYIDETYEIRALKSQKHHEMKLLMQTSEPNREKLTTLSQEIADVSKQLRDKRIDFALEAKKISPELEFGMGKGRRAGHRGRGNCFQNDGRQPYPDSPYQEQ